MRNMNCRDVRRDIDKMGSSDFLGPAVHAHLQSCEACATLSRKQANLKAILAGLPLVETPGDFDFRLQARLTAERQDKRPVAFSNFSLGFRSAAASLALFVLVAALAFVGYRARFGTPTVQQVAQQQNAPTSPNKPSEVSNPKANNPVVATVTKGTEASTVNTKQTTSKRREDRQEVAALRDRMGTRTISSMPASVLRRGNPSQAFPINASYQSLKVSVDHGSGTPRTISLPGVSFGSQKTLSQNATPLLASARAVW